MAFKQFNAMEFGLTNVIVGFSGSKYTNKLLLSNDPKIIRKSNTTTKLKF